MVQRDPIYSIPHTLNWYGACVKIIEIMLVHYY